MIDVGSIFARLILQDDFSKSLIAAQRNLDKAAKDMKAVGDKMVKVGVGLAPVSAAVAGVGIVAAKSFADFDAAMTESTAIMTGLNADTKKLMSDTARAVAKETSYSATQAAEAYYFLASAGLDAAQSVAALPKVAKFAQAGAFDLALATDLLTDAQSALGMTIRDDAIANMENMVKVSDTLVKANVLANASVEQFSRALTNKAGNAIKQLNIPLHEGVAILAAWADQGVKAEEAGERFNIVTRDLQRAARTNAAEFERYGISVFNAQGGFRSMIDIIRDLEKTLETMSAKQQGAALSALGFQDRSIAATRSLVGMSDAIQTYSDKLAAAGGTTEEVSNKQLDTFWKKLGLLKDRIVDVAIGLGENFSPSLDQFVQWGDRMASVIERVGNAFSKLPDSAQGAIVGLMGTIALASPVLVGLGFTIKTIGFAAEGLGVAAGAGALAIRKLGNAAKVSTTFLVGLRGASAGIIGLGLGLAFAVIANEVDRFRGKLRQMDEDAKKLVKARDLLGRNAKSLAEAEDVLKVAEAGRLGTQVEGVAITIDLARVWKEANDRANGAAVSTGKFSVSLEQAQKGMAGAAEKSEWAASASDFLTARLDATREMVAQLTSEERQNILAGDKLGLSVEAINESMHELFPSIRLTTEAVQMFVDGAKGAADKLEEFNKQVKDFSQASEANKDIGIISDTWVTMAGTYEEELAAVVRMTGKLTAEQRRSIDAGLALGHSVDQVADSLKLSKDVVGRYAAGMKTLWAENAKMSEGNVALVDTFSRLETSAGTMQQLLKATQFEVRNLSNEQKANIRAGLAMGVSVEELSKQLGISTEALRLFTSQSSALSVLAEGFAQLGQITGGALGKFLGTIGRVSSGLDTSRKIADETGGQFGILSLAFKEGATGSERLGAALASAGVVAQGFADVMASVGEETNKANAAMKGAMAGASAGSAFGPWGAAIGAVAGGLAGLFRAGSNARKAAEALRKETEKVTREFREAYPEIKNVNDVAQLLGITFVNVTEKWHLELLKEQMEQFNRQLDKARSLAGDLLSEAIDLGIGLPNALQESILKLAEMGLLTQDQTELFHTMLWEGQADWKKMKEAAERYGIEVEGLGAQYQQLRTTDLASAIINDYELLTKGGADVGSVLSGMADEISALVNDSIKFGTEIPENMKPWIEDLIKSGKLLDENGEAITDIGSIKFGATIETQFDKLIRKLDEFLEGLRQIPGLFGAAGSAAADVDWPAPPPSHPYPEDAPGFDQGGTAGVNWRRRSSRDVIPAWLRPGEVVFDPGTQSAPSAKMAAPPEAVTAVFDPTIVAKLYLDGKVVTDTVINRMGPRLAVRGGTP